MLKIIEKKLPVTVSPIEEKASFAKTVHGRETKKTVSIELGNLESLKSWK